MDYMGNKALIIASSLLVTIMITSGVLFTINTMTEVYGEVYDVDISLQSRFDEFTPYENSYYSGVEVKNTAKKYRNSKNITVLYYNGVTEKKINTDFEINQFDKSINNLLFYSTIEEDKNNEEIKTIKFSIKEKVGN